MTLRRVCEEHMTVVTDLLRKCGHHVEFNERGIRSPSLPENAKCGEIKTALYPGYPTDMQAQMTALCHHAGISVVKDTIFPQRFMHCSELKRMGRTSRWTTAPPYFRVETLSAPVMASDRGPPPPWFWQPEGGRHYGNPPPVPY
ncbi:MAG: hypothetical protein ACLSUW_06255 [Akkermansia sp.]